MGPTRMGPLHSFDLEHVSLKGMSSRLGPTGDV